jgi:hypothetical protein
MGNPKTREQIRCDLVETERAQVAWGSLKEHLAAVMPMLGSLLREHGTGEDASRHILYYSFLSGGARHRRWTVRLVERDKIKRHQPTVPDFVSLDPRGRGCDGTDYEMRVDLAFLAQFGWDDMGWTVVERQGKNVACRDMSKSLHAGALYAILTVQELEDCTG